MTFLADSAAQAAAAKPKRSLPLLARGEARRSPGSGVEGDLREAGVVVVQEGVRPKSVRVSITDRCDYACTYCRPQHAEGYTDRRLDLAAWATIVDGLVAAGIRRFRITGGEPLVHPRVVDLVALIASRGVDDLALTTNASQLVRLAPALRAAGLARVNISLDTLDQDRFAAITRGGRLADVLAGIDAAIAAGLGPVKLNTVVLRGQNDDELEDIVRYAWDRGATPRFLEIMPIAEGAKLVRDHLVTASEIRARLAHLLCEDTAEREPDRGPARYVRARTGVGRVGFISGTSDTYCKACDRLRVSSSGELRPCLATDDGVDAAAEATAGDVGAILGKLDEAWKMKPDGETFKGCTEASASGVSMRAIGG